MLLSIIADDLTGSNDSAAQFARLGLSTYTALPGAALNRDIQPDVLVLDSESRDIPAAEAYRTVAGITEQVQKLKPEVFYKKIDSTLRGNLGAEIRAIADKIRPSLIIVAPAYAAAGRTTVNGLQLLHGVRLEETELARVPKSPVKSSDIAAVICSQADFKVSHLGLSAIEEGAASLSHYFLNQAKEQPGQLIVCDCTSAEHLELIARSLSLLPNILYVGSAGFALALSEQLIVKKQPDRRPQVPKVLILSGSISAVTRAQTNRLLQENKETMLVQVSPRLALANPKAAAAECALKVTQNLGDYKVFLISAALREEDVEECRKQGELLGISFFEAGECMAKVMAEIMVLLSNDFAGFVMTGGDTAVHACAAVNASVLSLLGEVCPGIPVSEIVSGRHAHKFLITKAGAFGQENAFVEAVNYLFGN